MTVRLMKACLFSLAALFALSSLFLALFLREEVRGDLVVQSLIHLKDFSVYFWGQDRYLVWFHCFSFGIVIQSLGCI